ncbi:conserved hypothetical protein [Prochlorococcus marinus subsp. pastoris str. CCMP1986]|uniref:Uncharacterized protein n=1 Tax=Prochlorococcus marinus subsp. pastoris (strain CCMP1986 / NIES-2087 / MED4) TaxID=59919 RepID=Q7V1S2_PROMP|nr:hypothetical protein [Prochlorococcus marinus]KGF85825.1 hypothetical protein PROCH_1329 [Prochlorococcus marinus str. EQPAC1]CAE19242.1 conserved hypothetical protein [Prochlorococcus marinus subsp. pastoris str. CCMP1986]
MNIIFKFFSLCFTFLILILNNSEFAYGIGNVDWVLLKENNDGKEWIDMGSIKEINAGEITVLTKFLKNPKEPSDKEELSLYVMRINCNDKTYKDTSINGIPQFGSKWQTSNNDELIDVVIEKGCSEKID